MERPILFSAPMIRAILAGTKTQTRRVCKLASLASSEFDDCDWKRQERNGDWTHYTNEQLIEFKCPYGAPGDRLWVKETHQFVDLPHERIIVYRATTMTLQKRCNQTTLRVPLFYRAPIPPRGRKVARGKPLVQPR